MDFAYFDRMPGSVREHMLRTLHHRRSTLRARREAQSVVKNGGDTMHTKAQGIWVRLRRLDTNLSHAFLAFIGVVIMAGAAEPAGLLTLQNHTGLLDFGRQDIGTTSAA